MYTWNNETLTEHDEYDLQGTKFLDSHFSTSVNGDCEFVKENDATETDIGDKVFFDDRKQGVDQRIILERISGIGDERRDTKDEFEDDNAEATKEENASDNLLRRWLSSKDDPDLKNERQDDAGVQEGLNSIKGDLGPISGGSQLSLGADEKFAKVAADAACDDDLED